MSTNDLRPLPPSLARAVGDVCALPPGPITAREDLHEHLQRAIELEHAVVPPYLCALWSLDRSANPEASNLVSGVVVEEMLHMATVANLLNAVGGRPVLDGVDLLPGYPRPLPHTDKSFEIGLLPFGAEALELFLWTEHPGVAGPDEGRQCFDTVGHFYESLDRALVHLCDEHGEAKVFTGDPARQVTGGGMLVAIDDLASARAALQRIVEQGEGRPEGGLDESSFEVAHYYRFLELQVGRRFQATDTMASGPTGNPIWIDADAIRPMQPNPRLDDQVLGSAIREAQEEFNQEYCALLALLDQTFNGQPENLQETIRAMHALGAHGRALMDLEVPGTAYVAGPTFEYVDPDDRW